MPHSDQAQSRSGGIKIVSWNCNGLGHVVKRAKVFSHLKSLGADIVLQETHIKRSAQAKLRVGWIGQIYQSNFDAKARGGSNPDKEKHSFCLLILDFRS